MAVLEEENHKKEEHESQPDRLAEPVDMEQKPRLAFPVVGIGASAGGLEAFSEFFKAMPSQSGMAFVLVQHLPPERESMMADILSRHTAMPVLQVEDGLEVKPNHVYIIRPGRTMTIHDGMLHLGEPLEKPGHRRPVDDFFRSLAEEQRERAIGVIMSGMGSNGTAGAQVIKAVGGLCIAQNPESAKFPLMPRSLIDSGMADFVLSPSEIPEFLIRYAAHPYARGSNPPDVAVKTERQAINEILAILRARTRQDFNAYKKPTLVRRIQRRMGLNQITDMPDYTRLLRQTTAEVSALADDLMIHVTGFFRDPDSWEALQKKVIVPLVSERSDDGSIRAWVTACSSGEEAYTLAILLLEAAEIANKHFDIKVFATDTSDRSLVQARSGIFPGGIESEISPERLERFFDKNELNYRIKKEVRELVIFAPQNLLQDPPFSRLDICTCRNLLIYLEPPIQQRVLLLLHFGLREGGALLLGNSETVSGSEDLFEALDKKSRLYRRIGPTRHGAIEFPLPHVIVSTNEPQQTESRTLSRAAVAQMANRILLERYTPAAVVIDRQYHIVYFHGRTDQYLDQPRGEPTRELLSLAKESIRSAVRTALHKAIAENVTTTVRDGVIETDEKRRRIEITIFPLEPRADSSFFLVSFTEHSEPLKQPPSLAGELPENQLQLEEELRRIRDELQSTIEELQTSNEEMKASNEEITSINEELQSTNEEMETSKEELQSLNEELTTVNAQLQSKMEELEASTNDLSSLLSSTDIAVIFLDTHFRIRRFTPAVKGLLDLISSDIGRPLNDLARKFSDPDLLPDAQAVLGNLIPREKEIISDSARHYVRRVLPYRTGDNRINGVVITFIDITERSHAENALRESEERYRLILEGVTEYAIFMLSPEGRIINWPPGAKRAFGFLPQEAIGQPLSILFTPEDRESGIAEKQMKAAAESGSAVVEDHWHSRKDGSQFWGSGVLTALKDDKGSLRGFVKVLRDNTDRKQTEEALHHAKRAAEIANESKDRFLANVSHELRTPLSAILLWSAILADKENIDPGELREGLGAIKRSAEAQAELIEDLLDTARISSGKLRLELKDFSAVEMMQSALKSMNSVAAAKDIQLQQKLDPEAGMVHADPRRLQQVIWNLLSNAIKFTPSGGKITVVMQRHNDDLEIRVTDTGRGISKEFLPNVFDRFGQAELSTTRTKGGLGLGLTISKQLVELHGGVLTAQSDGPDQGSTFIAYLPLPRVSVDEQAAVINGDVLPRIADRLRGLHLLLVEDEMETRKALAAALKEAGANVTEADSAATGVKEFKNCRPNLIISDIGMPQEDGYSFMRQIRKLENKNGAISTPAIALSAFVQENDRRNAVESGFQQHMSKPVVPSNLISAVLSLLKKP